MNKKIDKICEGIMSYPLYAGILKDKAKALNSLKESLSVYKIKSFYLDPPNNNDCVVGKEIIIKENDRLHMISIGLSRSRIGIRRYGFLNLMSEDVMGDTYLNINHVASYIITDDIKDQYKLLREKKISIYNFYLFLQSKCNNMKRCHVCGV